VEWSSSSSFASSSFFFRSIIVFCHASHQHLYVTLFIQHSPALTYLHSTRTRVRNNMSQPLPLAAFFIVLLTIYWCYPSFLLPHRLCLVSQPATSLVRALFYGPRERKNYHTRLQCLCMEWKCNESVMVDVTIQALEQWRQNVLEWTDRGRREYLRIQFSSGKLVDSSHRFWLLSLPKKSQQDLLRFISRVKRP
jgi:hypothetical protein